MKGLLSESLGAPGKAWNTSWPWNSSAQTSWSAGGPCGAALDMGAAHLPSLAGQEHSLGVTNSLLLSWPLPAAQIPFVPKARVSLCPLLSAIWLLCQLPTCWSCEANPARHHSLKKAARAPCSVLSLLLLLTALQEIPSLLIYGQ